MKKTWCMKHPFKDGYLRETWCMKHPLKNGVGEFGIDKWGMSKIVCCMYKENIVYYLLKIHVWKYIMSLWNIHWENFIIIKLLLVKKHGKLIMKKLECLFFKLKASKNFKPNVLNLDQ